jgi:NAD-dependent SIR2 family protein deacetylase
MFCAAQDDSLAIAPIHAHARMTRGGTIRSHVRHRTQSMFDMKYFKRDQKPFFDFAAEIWPGNFAPAASHHFIQQVEAHGKLLR